MIVILIGPDEIGKTTLAELMRADGFEVRKLENADKKTKWQRRWWASTEYQSWSSLDPLHDIVYDRFPYPDELIYGGAGATQFARNIWEPRLEEYDVMFILLLPADDDEEYSVRAGNLWPEMRDKIIPLYKSFAMTSTRPILVRTTPDKPTPFTVKYIRDLAFGLSGVYQTRSIGS